MNYRILLLAAVLACSPAAAQTGVLDLSRPIDQQITVKNSEFDANVKYIGADMLVKVQSDDALYVSLRVGKNKKTGALAWGVVLQAEYYNRWRFYESASLTGGKLIPAQNLGRHVGSCYRSFCSFLEAAYVELGDEDVRTGLANGLKMRWNGRDFGSFEIVLPAAYFAAMEEVIKR